MLLAGQEDPDATDGNRTIFRTIWNSPLTGGEPWLIVLQHPGAGGGITPWRVFAYDQDHKMVSKGFVSFSEMRPLGIVEVKAESDLIPAYLNNEWMLAVVSSRTRDRAVSLDGLELPNWPNQPYVDIELVLWDDIADAFRQGNNNLDPRDIRRIVYRQAETGLSVTPEGVLKLSP